MQKTEMTKDEKMTCAMKMVSEFKATLKRETGVELLISTLGCQGDETNVVHLHTLRPESKKITNEILREVLADIARELQQEEEERDSKLCNLIEKAEMAVFIEETVLKALKENE